MESTSLPDTSQEPLMAGASQLPELLLSLCRLLEPGGIAGVSFMDAAGPAEPLAADLTSPAEAAL